MYEKIYDAIWGQGSEFPVYLGAVTVAMAMLAIGLKMLGH